MPLWLAKLIAVASSVGLVAIPHLVHFGEPRKQYGARRSVLLERVLLVLVVVGFVLPFIWVATPWLAFADYPSWTRVQTVGVASVLLGLWLLYRSHADLGSSWSITLEIHEQHRLVTHGAYHRIRHPMYLAILLYGLGQSLVIPNWLAGPAYFLAFGMLVSLRLPREEHMLRDTFGAAYVDYVARSDRLLPGIF